MSASPGTSLRYFARCDSSAGDKSPLRSRFSQSVRHSTKRSFATLVNRRYGSPSSSPSAPRSRVAAMVCQSKPTILRKPQMLQFAHPCRASGPRPRRAVRHALLRDHWQQRVGSDAGRTAHVGEALTLSSWYPRHLFLKKLGDTMTAAEETSSC